MLDILLNLGSFLLGISIGKMQGVNTDITKQTSYMQDLIDQAYEERNATKDLWLRAEENAETWKRRYFNLFDEIEEEEDE